MTLVFLGFGVAWKVVAWLSGKPKLKFRTVFGVDMGRSSGLGWLRVGKVRSVAWKIRAVADQLVVGSEMDQKVVEGLGG